MCILRGDTHGLCLQITVKKNIISESSVEHYLKTRASQGFNAVHAMLLSEAGWGNSWEECHSSIYDNKCHLILTIGKKVDARIAFANKQGLIVGLVPGMGR